MSSSVAIIQLKKKQLGMYRVIIIYNLERVNQITS